VSQDSSPRCSESSLRTFPRNRSLRYGSTNSSCSVSHLVSSLSQYFSFMDTAAWRRRNLFPWNQHLPARRE